MAEQYPTVTTRTLAFCDDAVAQAAQAIGAGQPVAVPTETVYGLAADATDAVAVARIYAAKGRPSFNPLIVHVPDLAAAEKLAVFDQRARVLAAAFWPGPLTLVLPRGERIPPNVSAGLPTVAVRMPSHPVALALIRAAGVPIAAPSANLFSRISPTSARHVQDSLGNRIPMLLDSGPTLVGVESTILDLSGELPTILRFGGVPLEALEKIAPGLSVGVKHVSKDEAQAAPGMLLKHYAPRARLTLVAGNDSEIRRAMVRFVRERLPNGEMLGLLLAEEDRDLLNEFPDHANIRCVFPGKLSNLDAVAHGLYAALHTLDDCGVVQIFARVFPDEGMGRAINDRLIRAASGQVVR